ncbi:N-6 DNA methylase, partial [Salmonella enterica]|uniref:N-6 DNA methylase n=1 Tax=Salmonella enterica TaxID=28901 RepID=UPI00398C77A2
MQKANGGATKPPFGRAAGNNITRTFVHPTSNTQLCLMRHIIETRHPGGRAAVVVPDNVLFAGGNAPERRPHLLDKSTRTTMLPLTPCTFCSLGVNSYVPCVH